MKTLILVALALTTSSAFGATSEKCPGEEGYFYTNYRHTNNPTEGGFVAYSATIQDSPSIVIGKLASVCGNAIILNNANIGGSAIVRGDAEVSGSSIITGSVILEGSVKVGGASVIKGAGTLSSGEYIDTIKTLADTSSGSSAPTLSALDIASKLQQYVSTYISKFTYSDGPYTSGDRITQSIRFTNGPCKVSINKQRTSINGVDNYYYTTSTITFSMRDVTKILPRVYGPTLVTSNIQIPDFKNNPSVTIHQTAANGESSTNDWSWARAIYFNKDTVEAIESPTEGHAKNVQSLLTDLMNACK